MNNDWVYDVEIFPNVFTIAFEHTEAPIKVAYEISEFRNDTGALLEFLHWLKVKHGRLVGFNNVGFDYPILHTLVQMGKGDANTLYQKGQAIIESAKGEFGRFAHRVRPSDCFIPQVDLYLIHHFDNAAHSTSLKMLEFNMRMHTIEDLPFPVGTVLNPEHVKVLKQYNTHDVSATKAFYHHSAEMLAFRAELTRKYGQDFTNKNDTAIGKAFFVMKLEEAGVSCYDFGPKGRTPRQTPRPIINLKDAILPWIQFEQPEFNRVLNWFKEQSITETKGVFKDIVAKVEGFDFVFGLGGIHGSVKNKVVQADDEHVILDLDVTSYYPNIAIQNNLYPQHLGETFGRIYQSLFEQRKKYGKKSAESQMLKLALNGVYGDSGNKFSVFYDPLFTMSITLNGQLLLCMLAERLMQNPDLRILQINTDGITIRVPSNRFSRASVDATCKRWELMTRMTLESVEYDRMFIRDVNNYIGVYKDGKVKRKGAYEHQAGGWYDSGYNGWSQNASALVVPKVAEKVLVHGAPIRKTVEEWPDLFDFMLRTKVPRTSYLRWGEDQVQRVTRYYVCKKGHPLIKWMPPLKGKTEWRQIGVESGWNVMVCNHVGDAFLNHEPDYDYYVQEVEKLVNILR